MYGKFTLHNCPRNFSLDSGKVFFAVRIKYLSFSDPEENLVNSDCKLVRPEGEYYGENGASSGRKMRWCCGQKETGSIRRVLFCSFDCNANARALYFWMRG